MVHQRTNTRLPTRDEQRLIQRELGLPPIDPPQGQAGGSGGETTRTQWTDRGDSVKRADFAKELMTRLEIVTSSKLAEFAWKRDARTLPIKSLWGAEKAAQQAVDATFGEWCKNAVLTPGQRAFRQKHAFVGDGARLVDASDETTREKIGQPINPWDMAAFFTANDPDMRELAAQHHFDPYHGAADEAEFLRDQVLRPFVDAHRKELYDCDRLGYFSTRPGLGKVIVALEVKDWLAQEDETAQAPMQKKYDVLQSLIHECIHTVEHPLVNDATKGVMPVREGVCEWLTCQVIDRLSKTGGGELRDIIQAVEGSVPQGREPALRTYLAKYQPKPEYSAYVTAVQQVASAIGGPNGVQAAYLQGHAEFLGLFPYGMWLDGAEVRDGERLIPQASLSTVPDMESLIKATGLTESKILQDNPELESAGPLRQAWPRGVLLRGFHVHGMIEVSDPGKDAAVYRESWQQIADQHGITVTELMAANGLSDAQAVPDTFWLLVPDRN
jgi:LysM domain